VIKIAEAKKLSPFDGEISPFPMERLIEQAIIEGDWVSIHTEAPWGGSLDTLRMARKMTTKPILAKGIHKTDESIQAAFDLGANYVLCVGRNPNINNVIIEPIQMGDFSDYPVVLWNRRDLSTGKPKVFNWADVRKTYKGILGCGSYGYPFPWDADFCLYSIRPK